MIRLIITSFLFCSALAVTAQSLTKSWDHSYGGNGDERFNAMIESTGGQIFAVGHTTSAGAGQQDALLVVTDARSGQQLGYLTFGGDQNDSFSDIIQTADGRFVLAGYTESSGAGRADGWLLVINDRGRILAEKTFGTGKDDAFQSLALAPDGRGVLAAGYRENQKEGDIWLLYFDEGEAAWEKTIGSGHFENVRALTTTADGQFALAGNTSNSLKRDRGDIFLMKVDRAGTPVWERFFGDRHWDEAYDLITTDDGGFAIAGYTSTPANDKEMWLIRTDAEGYHQWEKAIGGRDEDLALSIAQTGDGGFLLAGKTKSYRANARQFKGRIIKTDRGGQLQWQQDYGDNREDEITAVTLVHDGAFAIAGMTQNQGDGMGQAWLFRLEDNAEMAHSLTNLLAKSENIKLRLGDIRLLTPDGLLKPEDRTYYQIEVTNESNFDLADIQLRVEGTEGLADLKIWENNYLNKLAAGETATIRVPVNAGEALTSGRKSLDFVLSAAGKKMDTRKVSLETKQPTPAKLSVVNIQYQRQDTRDVFSPIEVKVDIQNTGDFPTREVLVNFGYPQGLQPTGGHTRLGVISAHQTATANFSFKKTAAFQGNEAVIYLRVTDDGTEKVSESIKVELGGPVIEDPSLAIKKPLLIWTEPDQNDPNLRLDNLSTSEPFMNIRMTVASPSKLNAQDFKVSINGDDLDGSKLLEEELREDSLEDQLQTYTYRNKVRLEPGENIIYIKVRDSESKKITIYYRPQSRNLHVLAIGPEHQDLRFTRKDAEDFAEAFRQQKGGALFNEVFIKTLNLPENTDRQNIQKALLDLKFQYSSPNAPDAIRSNDLLVVFVSSHGKRGEGDRFKILPSDYDPKYGDFFTIDFQSDFLQPLQSIECKQLVFIDACHSGSAGGRNEYSNDLERSAVIIEQYNRIAPGLTTVTSCQSMEMSYEDDAWQNGAFTEAMLEAFQNLPVEDEQGNVYRATEDDRFITVRELYQYLERRVPGLIKKYKPGAPTSQQPVLSDGNLDIDLPFYEVKNN